MHIIKPSAHMISSPSGGNILETECLFGEKIEILNENLEWIYCRLLTDNYLGWIKKNNLGKLDEPTHRVVIKRSFIYEDRNPKSNCKLYLPMGSQIFVEKIYENWAKTIFFNNVNKIVGYVPTQHIVKLSYKDRDWVKFALQLLDTPYRWGGRDTLGIDCSALLQLSYQAYGHNIPRNTSEQILLEKKIVKNIKDLKRGCVVFWQGHVGIMIDNINCIHANAFHMKTKTEPLYKIVKRMSKDNHIRKMMDFN